MKRHAVERKFEALLCFPESCRQAGDENVMKSAIERGNNRKKYSKEINHNGIVVKEMCVNEASALIISVIKSGRQ
jgi:hypothetical protein